MAPQLPPEILLMILEELVKLIFTIDLCSNPKALDGLLQYFFINRYIWSRRHGLIWPNIRVVEHIFFNESPMLLTLPIRHLQHIQRVELRLLKMPGPIVPSHFSDLPHVLQTMNAAMPQLHVLEVVIPGFEHIKNYGLLFCNSYAAMIISSTATTFNNHCRQDIKIFLRLQYETYDDEHPNGPASITDMTEAILSYPPGKVELERS